MRRVNSTRSRALLLVASAGAALALLQCTAGGTGPPGATDGVPDPTLLPVASGQAPNFAAYDALNIPARAAGYRYNDPLTGVRIWKVTSATVPTANSGAGHDYAEGGAAVSLGWGPNGKTHTILILTFTPGSNYYLVDFTRGMGFSNYRRLTVQPARDLCAAFSHLATQARILYIHTGSQLVRYNTATMAVENTGRFPATFDIFAWLHQDKNDIWFTGLLADNLTVWTWNSQTGQFLTHLETWNNEPHMEREGRYVVLTSGGAYATVRLWDLSSNTFGPTQDAGFQFHFSHGSSARSLFVMVDANASAPQAEDRYDVVGSQLARTQIFTNSGGDSHGSGNWIQTDAELGGNLLKQWTYVTGESGPELSWYDQLAWKYAVGLQRSDGSDQRVLLHHYSVQPHPDYYDYPWGQPSPDGKVVIFNSNMNGSGRWDLFAAEMPLRAP